MEVAEIAESIGRGKEESRRREGKESPVTRFWQIRAADVKFEIGNWGPGTDTSW